MSRRLSACDGSVAGEADTALISTQLAATFFFFTSTRTRISVLTNTEYLMKPVQNFMFLPQMLCGTTQPNYCAEENVVVFFLQKLSEILMPYKHKNACTYTWWL